jgi:hypothetical protein
MEAKGSPRPDAGGHVRMVIDPRGPLCSAPWSKSSPPAPPATLGLWSVVSPTEMEAYE